MGVLDHVTYFLIHDRPIPAKIYSLSSGVGADIQ